MKNNDEALPLVNKLHSETALIAWTELQRFFAKGAVLVVQSDLDLVMIASYFAEDNTQQLQPLLDAKQIVPASDKQARQWFEQDAQLWSVVVAPFVLVQTK